MSLKSVLHTVGTLLAHPGLGGGSNLGLEKGAILVRMVGNVAESPELAELEKDVKAIFHNNGQPPKGLWEKMVEKYDQVEEVVEDVKEVAKVAVKGKKKKGDTDPPNDAPQDPQA